MSESRLETEDQSFLFAKVMICFSHQSCHNYRVSMFLPGQITSLFIYSLMSWQGHELGQGIGQELGHKQNK